MVLDGVVELYKKSNRRNACLLSGCLLFLFSLAVYALSAGSYHLSAGRIIQVFVGTAGEQERIIVWTIRMPRIVAAIVAGCGLALAGVVMQSLLKNPLVSPSTLGISHGAAFGAAFAIVVLGAGAMQSGALRTAASDPVTINRVLTTTGAAFLGSMVTSIFILFLGKMRRLNPQSIILAGVALSSLFVSGTILIQYFASDVQLASIVFWTFGDLGRSNWQEIGVMTAAILIAMLYVLKHRLSLNALASGDDVAKSVGVNVDRMRIWGMLMASLASSLVTAFHGVIAFLGLLAPHIARRLVGSNHVFLIPTSCVIGAILLLAADTIGRSIIGPGTLPVGVLTSFMGGPLFLYLLIRGHSR
jgi:iron complex transport system permease protein